jgi:transcriptional regulator GlxA family with amidase domain
MTVHWEHAPALTEMNAELLLSHTLYVRDRDRITCAGGVSPLDMMHSLLAEHHGEVFARRVSDWFVHTDIRPAAGPTRAGIVERYEISNATIVQVIEQMSNHLADPLSLSQFAMLVGRTTRQLNRLFSEYLGQSTMTFYRHLRLDHAKHLLEQTTLSITEIAFATGFSSGAHFSQSFKTKFEQPPSSFR